MLNLLAAIVNKYVGSALSYGVGGRIFLDVAPEGTEYPYIVFTVISDTPDKTFTEVYEDVLIQFSIYSASASAAEIGTIYADLIALFDECALTISGSTLVWMWRSNLATMVDDITTPAGTSTVKHWAVDFDVKTSLN